MTGERPDDAREPEDTSGPADGADGLEARGGSATDAPFPGLRSAADIFGAPRSADDWPSRRERREAEKAARETGAPLPEPFEPAAAEDAAAPDDAAAPGGVAAPDDAAAPDVAAAPGGVAPDAGDTQAIRMDDELREPSVNSQASAEHERETLGERIPPAAPVPPASTAPHPSSITLPTAVTNREQRAAENRAVDEERRRTDPFGQGRSDVDWLGRATGSQPPAPTPTPTGPVAQPLGVESVLPVGVEPVLPSSQEPPSFTELLRLQGAEDAEGRPGGERPFDWAIRDDETGEVPTTLTTDRFDTTALGAGAWSLADEADDDVVSGEVPTPPGGVVPVALPGAAGAGAGAGAGAAVASGAAREDDEDDEAPAPGAATPWWAAEPEAPQHEPVAAVPPLVEPVSTPDRADVPTSHLPAVEDDLDAVMGIRRGRSEDTADDGHADRPDRLPSGAPDDLDQSEWDGRETSDTSAIKDLFGTEAVGALGGTGYDPHDTGTRMMPAVDRTEAQASPRAPSAAPAAAPAASRAGALAGAGARAGAAAGASAGSSAGSGSGSGSGDGGRENFINEGFGRLRNEGQRGKVLLIGGAVVLIVVLLVAVFALTRWILGNDIREETPAASATTAASAPASASAAPSTTPEASADAGTAQGGQSLQFPTTQAAPGEHAWNELAGGECLSPFSNAWAETYTVVDCQSPHVAQLTARLQVDAQQWPGTEALATQASQRCQTSEAIDTSAAAAYGDVQVQGSYAPDQATWDQGNHFVSCFATRSSGGTLTGSLAPTGT